MAAVDFSVHWRNPSPAPARCLRKESTIDESTPEEPIRIDADKARGAEIILKKRRNRLIFIAGLVGLVLLALVARCTA